MNDQPSNDGTDEMMGTMGTIGRGDGGDACLALSSSPTVIHYNIYNA
jgi:hypothetical protein